MFLPIERRLDVGAARLAAQHMKAPHYILQDTGSSDHTIGLFARMQVVVSMRLHALVFAAGQGVPLVGVVYDQKISSFLSYIGQDLYTDLDAVTAEGLRAHIDAACARIGDQEFLSGGVDRLRQVEQRNSETARAAAGEVSGIAADCLPVRRALADGAHPHPAADDPPEGRPGALLRAAGPPLAAAGAADAPRPDGVHPPPLPEVERRHALLHRSGGGGWPGFILRQMERHRFREPLLWCTAPEQVHLLELLPHRGVVYDCDRDWFDLPPGWESDLALAADVVFAASPGLSDHLSPCNDNIALLPNGVNFPMFTRTPADCPPELRGLTGPVLGYVGTIWPDLDLSPALRAARAMPECLLPLSGPAEGQPCRRRAGALPNVRFLGARRPVEVPDYLARFDVCLDFLRLDNLKNDILSPRLYEYLATGLPIVTLLPPDQVEPFPDVVYTAHTDEEFARLCRRALEETGSWARERRREHARQAAWSVRAGQVIRILRTIGLY